MRIIFGQPPLTKGVGVGWMHGHLLIGVATLGTIEFLLLFFYLTNFGTIFLVLPNWLHVKLLPTETQVDLKTTKATSVLKVLWK